MVGGSVRWGGVVATLVIYLLGVALLAADVLVAAGNVAAGFAGFGATTPGWFLPAAGTSFALVAVAPVVAALASDRRRPLRRAALAALVLVGSFVFLWTHSLGGDGPLLLATVLSPFVVSPTLAFLIAFRPPNAHAIPWRVAALAGVITTGALVGLDNGLLYGSCGALLAPLAIGVADELATATAGSARRG